MRVLIAGGGTGGHLFPGIAVAEEVTTRDTRNEVLFVGTNRGLEARVVPAYGWPLEVIQVQGLKGKGVGGLLRSLMQLPRALADSIRILRRWQPDVVLGVGGYASGPVVLAAWLLRIPTAVQEQNALPGLTNRILGMFVSRVFVAFEEARASFPVDKVVLIGNPIRRKLMDNYLSGSVTHAHFTVLVVGGSLGARGLNQRIIEALPHLADLKDVLRFVHQTGKTSIDEVRAGYEAAGIQGEVVEFIDDMSAAYETAELVVCRAGATTLAELTVCKKASILVPFPHATDNHQEVNAKALVEEGAAVMFREAELTGERLAEEIRALYQDPARRKKMEKRASRLGRPEAAKELADVCVELMQAAWGPKGREREAEGEARS